MAPERCEPPRPWTNSATGSVGRQPAGTVSCRTRRSPSGRRTRRRKVGVNLGRVEFYHIPTDRVWTRDYCPLFVADDTGAVALTDWHFNGWAKYSNWQRDDAVTGRIGELLGRPVLQPLLHGRRVVLEGGSIDVNGQGLLLTTEECLLSPVQERNPGVTPAELERVLGEYLGARKVLWLNRG